VKLFDFVCPEEPTTLGQGSTIKSSGEIVFCCTKVSMGQKSPFYGEANNVFVTAKQAGIG
jgi:hypothetical protein